MALATALAACAFAPTAQAQLGGGLLELPGVELPGGGQAPAQVPAYQADDGRGVRNILPPGQNGLLNAPQLGAFASAGARPKHSDDQLKMYGDLVFATPGLSAASLDNFFKDASFGVKPGDVERSYSPRSDVTILRDKGFGVPHVYGSTRAGSMFGAGYVGGEDRLFFMDVLRNLGRAQLSTFAGGANREMDREQWLQTPYTEADLQRQVDQLDDLYGAEGKQIQDDAAAYVDGINAYIANAKINPLLMPAEYAAIGRAGGPEPWSTRDVIATAALVGGIFGKGGGEELDSALAYQEARRLFGKRVGTKVWRDFRSAEDPEAPTTVLRKRFPYQAQPKKVRKNSVALPDRGSVKKSKAVPGESASGSSTASSGGPLDGLLAFPTANSNALLVSAKESQTGRPIAVMGPQTGYFAPQILMEIDIHGPGIDARGAAFPGVNLYVQLGRGRDYAFSATSAGQDIIDTFAAPLCEPGGDAPTLDSMHYIFRGKCEPIEVLERKNSWMSSAGDMTPSGSETLRAERTKLGIVNARATIKGKPVVYTKLRSTYLHEVDSARGFVDFNDPAKMRNAQDFKRAAAKIGYTFNWLYADDRDIAYYNSGNNPVRSKRVDTSLPTQSRFPWRRFDAEANTAAYTSFESHPNKINQGFLTSWNNKPARGYRAADSTFEYTSIYRSEPLDDRIRAKIRGAGRMNLPQLVDAMATSGVVDLRGDKVLGVVLTAMGKQSDPALRDAVAKLRAWRAGGSLRRDDNRDGTYEHAEAIRIMDAWWPKLVEAQFAPTLGKPLLDRFLAIKRLDNEPNNKGDHLGSAYQAGSYGLVEKDLRTLLGPKRLRKAGFSRDIVRVRGKYSRVYCGATKRRKATLRRCRRALAGSLKSALGVGPDKLYEDKTCGSQPGLGPKDPGRKPRDQACFDRIRFRPLGAAEQPLIHWQNRPTFQQIIEFESHRPR